MGVAAPVHPPWARGEKRDRGEVEAGVCSRRAFDTVAVTARKATQPDPVAWLGAFCVGALPSGFGLLATHREMGDGQRPFGCLPDGAGDQVLARRQRRNLRDDVARESVANDKP